MTSDASTGPAFAAGARTTFSQPLARPGHLLGRRRIAQLAQAPFRDTPWSVRING